MKYILNKFCFVSKFIKAIMVLATLTSLQAMQEESSKIQGKEVKPFKLFSSSSSLEEALASSAQDFPHTWYDASWADNKVSSSGDDHSLIFLNSLSSDTGSKTHSGTTDSSSGEEPLALKKSGLRKLCEHPFDFLLMPKAFLRNLQPYRIIDQTIEQQEEEIVLTNDLVCYIFEIFLQNSTEEYLPAHYGFHTPLEERPISNQVYPLFWDYNSLRSNYCRLSLLCRQSYKAMCVNTIENVFSSFLRFGFDDQCRSALITPSTSDCISFSTHLFDQLKAMPLTIGLCSGFATLPSSNNPHGVIFCSQASPETAIDSLYEVLYDISRENALKGASSFLPVESYKNYYEYLVNKHSINIRFHFTKIVKTCCFAQEEEKNSQTFMRLISQGKRLLTQRIEGLELQTAANILTNKILSPFDTLYQINFSHVEGQFSILIDKIFDRHFSNLVSDTPAEKLGTRQAEILDQCQEYSVLRGALLQYLTSIDSHTASATFLSTHIFCPSRLLYFTDLFTTYLDCVGINDRMNMIGKALGSLKVLWENEKCNLGIIGYILGRQMKNNSFLQDFETADGVLLEALSTHQASLLPYIPENWVLSDTKGNDILEALRKIMTSDLQQEDLEKIQKLLLKFSKK